jgi:hypothetical protein
LDGDRVRLRRRNLGSWARSLAQLLQKVTYEISLHSFFKMTSQINRFIYGPGPDRIYRGEVLCYDTLILQARVAERCPSGRRSTIGNRVFRQNRDRGFKSHSLRHPSLKLRMASHRVILRQGLLAEEARRARFAGWQAIGVEIKLDLVDSRVLRNKRLQTPPDPEGSNGSNPLCVPQGCLAINKLIYVGGQRLEASGESFTNEG